MANIDKELVESFGVEWNDHDQALIDTIELQRMYYDYFSIFPWNELPENSIGFDMGCGSGRWAKFVAPNVHTLHCIEPSQAIERAKTLLADFPNVIFHNTDLDNVPLAVSSQDFGYSLGVLHHIPDTSNALICCVKLLKPGAPFLLYLYYSFDNRPVWYKFLWKLSETFRRIISRLPNSSKSYVTNIIGYFVYYPLARTAKLFEVLGLDINNFPLQYYRNKSLKTILTDSRDRFGTRLEHRFSKKDIEKMMVNSGLRDIRFSEAAPFWCAIGYRA